MTEEPLMELIIDIKQTKKWKHNFEQDVLVAWWLAIHVENLEVANKLMCLDPMLRYIATLAVKRKSEMDPINRAR
jgi:hypothetical protein